MVTPIKKDHDSNHIENRIRIKSEMRGLSEIFRNSDKSWDVRYIQWDSDLF